jgi:hypothetical protein
VEVDNGGVGVLAGYCIYTGQTDGKLFDSADSEEMHIGTGWDGYTGANFLINYKFGSLLIDNTLRLHYKDKFINAV